MKNFALAVIWLFILAGTAAAQQSLPASIRDHYLNMPPVAERNLAGLQFAPYSADHWYKGNIHCHSNTDGERMPRHADSTPAGVIKWYASHGYDFVALTDHNYFHRDLAAPPGILYIPSEEITTSKYHMNGIGTSGYIRPLFDAPKVQAYQAGADAVAAQGGVMQVNHPITPLGYVYPEDLLALKGVNLFEVYNMQPGSYKALGEPLWDNLLTRGAVWWGTATDDGHFFGPVRPVGISDPPGGGFVMVDAPELSRDAIVAALRAGHFYASTGVLVKSYRVTAEAIEVEAAQCADCRIDFIGAQGKVLASQAASRASYQVTGKELYVRARLTDRQGALALMQPVFYR